MFCQIVYIEQIHVGKIIQNMRFTDKRVKVSYNYINWIHKATNETDFVLSQCLLGLHKINESYQKNYCDC